MARSKRARFGVVAGIIVVVVIVAVAVIASGSAARDMTVAQAVESADAGQRVKVTGTVVNDSWTIEGDNLSFAISDEDDATQTLEVVYDKGVSATFGNGVTAICTGEMGDDGVLRCSDLVTKCPSKYETATDALTVSAATGYGDAIVDKPIKMKGTVASQISDASQDVRFVIADESDPAQTVDVSYAGAIPDGIGEGSVVILTGSLDGQGDFAATELAQPDTEE